MINFEQLRLKISEQGFFVLDVPEIRALAIDARNEYLVTLKAGVTHPPAEKFSIDEIKDDFWRKNSIGESNGVGENYAQFLLTTYFFKNNSKYNHLEKLFNNLICIRNTLTGVNLEFGNQPITDKYWNANRVHHYPSGGGFMMAHKDTHFPPILESTGNGFLQIMCLLSNRGEHFNSGGLFLNIKGNKFYLEDENSLGKIVAFDGRIIHGVESVDLDKSLNLKSDAGRLCAISSLYKAIK